MNGFDSKMDAQVSYGFGPLSVDSLGSFQKEVETIVFGQGVKSGVLGADFGQGKSSGFGVETTNSGQGKIHCATIVGSGLCLSVGFGNVSSFGSIVATGISNQIVGICSSLLKEVMTNGPCQKLDEFPSILDSQIW